MSDQPPKTSRTGVSLPGQPTEEAIADVGTEAGRSLLRGLGKLGDAALGPWFAKREAKAAAAKLAIETGAKIDATQAVVDARRKNDLEEAGHQELLARRAQRLRIELAREQENLEAIERKALEFTELDPESGSAQEIDEDWLFQCADFAQRVSDEDVQLLWARVMSSAAISGRQRLSAQALQTLSLFDKRAALDFQKFVFVIAHLGYFPAMEHKHDQDPQSIDIDALKDLGVVDSSTNTAPYRFKDFIIEPGSSNVGLTLFKDRFGLTKRGSDIANAVFGLSDFNPGEHLIDEYLRITVQREIRNNKGVTIFTPGAAGHWPAAFSIAPSVGEAKTDWQKDGRYINGSSRLKSLLDWASQRYAVQTR